MSAIAAYDTLYSEHSMAYCAVVVQYMQYVNTLFACLYGTPFTTKCDAFGFGLSSTYDSCFSDDNRFGSVNPG